MKFSSRTMPLKEGALVNTPPLEANNKNPMQIPRQAAGSFIRIPIREKLQIFDSQGAHFSY
jgi:hypothetical protein